MKPPTGDEAFYVMATREPMAFIAEADILQGGDGLASIDPQSGRVLPEAGPGSGSHQPRRPQRRDAKNVDHQQLTAQGTPTFWRRSS